MLVTALTLTINLGVAISDGLVVSALVHDAHQLVKTQTASPAQVQAEQLKMYHLDGPLFFGNARSRAGRDRSLIAWQLMR